ncbi:MAG: DUF3662 and FHA domain-containing protein [Actinomycetota bacterium]
MGLIDEFEKRLERVVEGAFNKAFRSNIQPSEIGRRLLREMEGGKSVSVGAVYVPNRYTIELDPTDHERIAGLIPTLVTEFVELLKRNASERRWLLAGDVQVLFAETEELSQGSFAIRAEHDSSEDPVDLGLTEPKRPTRLELRDDPQQSWELTDETLRLGRDKTNDVVLADPNASRHHAEIQNRRNDHWIIDLSSTNGTMVNETLIKERQIVPGDHIRIGTSVLVYHAEGD